MEKLGTGIKLILDSCSEMNLKKPDFNEDGDFIKVKLYFQKEYSSKLNDKERILELGKDLKELRIKDIIEHLKVSRNTATRKLNELIKENYFERKGKGPSTRYIYKKLD